MCPNMVQTGFLLFHNSDTHSLTPSRLCVQFFLKLGTMNLGL